MAGAKSDAQSRLMELWSRLGLPAPARDYPFLDTDDVPVGGRRKFELDLAWPGVKLGIEVEGGIWSGGAHGRGTGILRDIEKQNLAVMHGWRVLRTTSKDAERGDIIPLVARLLGYAITVRNVESVDWEHPNRREIRMRKQIATKQDRATTKKGTRMPKKSAPAKKSTPAKKDAPAKSKQQSLTVKKGTNEVVLKTPKGPKIVKV